MAALYSPMWVPERPLLLWLLHISKVSPLVLKITFYWSGAERFLLSLFTVIILYVAEEKASFDIFIVSFREANR